MQSRVVRSPFVLLLFSALIWIAAVVPEQLSAQSVVLDPLGDTFGSALFNVDIAQLDSMVTANDVTLFVGFHHEIAPASRLATNSVVGFIDLDTDQNAATGAPSNQSRFSPVGDSDLGSDFFVDLFSEQFASGQAELVDTSTMFSVGRVPINFELDQLSVTIPLSLLGGDDGKLDYSVIVGDVRDYSDDAVAATIPEPSAWSVWMLVVGLMCRRQAKCNPAV